MAERFPCTGEPVTPCPLVLLHGWGFDSRIWVDIIPALQSSFNVITLDLPCFGNNTFCSPNIDEVAQHVVDQLPGKSILLGWSLGGMVATYVAIHFPQRVYSFITVGSNLKWVAIDNAGEYWPGASSENFAAFFENLVQNFEGTKQHFCGVIARGDRNEKKLTRLLRNCLSKTSKESFLQGLRLLSAIDNRSGFVSISTPGLHVFGEHDVLVPLAVEQAMRALDTKQQISIIPSTSHAPFLSKPDLFVGMIRNFVCPTSYQSNKNALDKNRIAASFSKASVTYDSAAQLQREIGDQLFAMLSKQSPETILDLGCGTGLYSRQLQQSFPQAYVISFDIAPGMLRTARSSGRSMMSVCGDAEYLPFKDNAVDIIFSNLAIQWCQDHPQLFAELFRVLAPDGQCVISTFGEGTLCELKTAWRQVDDNVHVNQFSCADFLQQSALKAGFCSIELQRQSLVRYYDQVKQLTRELKTIGAHNINHGRPSGLTGKHKLGKFLDAYELYRCNDKLPAHYEVIYLTLKKEK